MQIESHILMTMKIRFDLLLCTKHQFSRKKNLTNLEIYILRSENSLVVKKFIISPLGLSFCLCKNGYLNGLGDNKKESS